MSRFLPLTNHNWTEVGHMLGVCGLRVYPLATDQPAVLENEDLLTSQDELVLHR